MTGYGRGESNLKQGQATVEITTVNRKQAEILVTLPRELESLEARIRTISADHILRGRAQIKVTLKATASSRIGVPRLNKEIAQAVVAQLRELSVELQLKNEQPALEHVLRAPGVFQSGVDENDIETAWEIIEPGVKEGLNTHVSDESERRQSTRKGDETTYQQHHHYDEKGEGSFSRRSKRTISNNYNVALSAQAWRYRWTTTNAYSKKSSSSLIVQTFQKNWTG